MKLSIMIYSLIFLTSGASHTAALSAEPDAGKIFYMQHCSSCHGQEGHGNGPVSRYLNVKVPDLTLIKKEQQRDLPFR